MTQRYLTQLVDDLDGTTADTTITFGLDGKQYAIDLTDEHAHDLKSVLEPHVTAARKSDMNVKTKTTSSGKRGDLAAIRDWAKNNGYTVADRGRVAVEIQQAYDAVH